jgi:coenzyme F420-dependent glucose-6-phosphate dehydrogenase
MIKVGYWLASELHGPGKLVSDAKRAEDIGFEYAMISDHYHPWLDDQGHSPFVWSVIGGIAHATEWLRLGTSAAIMPERFFLGVGTGENLNEHVHGDKWPVARDRLEMLEEAVEVIRSLWAGELTATGASSIS